jgi:hypothetical protein
MHLEQAAVRTAKLESYATNPDKAEYRDVAPLITKYRILISELPDQVIGEIAAAPEMAEILHELAYGELTGGAMNALMAKSRTILAAINKES